MGQKYERDGVWLEVPEPTLLRTVIRSALLNALAWANGSQKKAGAALGISGRMMHHMMKSYDIPVGRSRTRKSR